MNKLSGSIKVKILTLSKFVMLGVIILLGAAGISPAASEVIYKEPPAQKLTTVKLSGLSLKEVVRLVCSGKKYQFSNVSDAVLNKEVTFTVTDATSDEVLQYLATSNDLLLVKAGDSITFEGLEKYEIVFRKPPTGSSFNASFFEGEMGGVQTTAVTGGAAASTGGAAAASPAAVSTTSSSGSQGVTISSSTEKLDFWDELDKNLKKIVTKDGFYTIDRSSSFVYVVEKPSRVKIARQFLESIDKTVNRQVSIEVTVIQVHKGGTITYGVDWDSIVKTVTSQVLSFNTAAAFSDPTSPFSIGASLTKTNSVHSAVIHAVEKFADVKIVEKTTLQLGNNQAGSFSRGEERSYLDSISRTIIDHETTTSVVKGKILSGLNIYVLPTIVGDTVTISFMPRITELQSMESISIDNGSIQNPILNVQKNIATVTLKNGETRIVSSISQGTQGHQDTMVPGVSKIPVIGWLFGGKIISDEDSGLMFIITPTIIDL